MIGILALQGDFAAHKKILDRLQIENRAVRLPRDLEGVHGLIIPGGESTTMLKLMDAFELYQPLVAFGQAGKPVLGTCAGAILMCTKVSNQQQKSLGWIPAGIERNAYGSQRESFLLDQDCPPWNLTAVPGFFIRAPRFVSLDEGVNVLSRSEQDITGVTYKNFTAVSYHPELADDTRFHRAWYERFVMTSGNPS